MLAGGEGGLPVKVDGDKHNRHLAHTVHGAWSGTGESGGVKEERRKGGEKERGVREGERSRRREGRRGGGKWERRGGKTRREGGRSAVGELWVSRE